MCLVMVPISGKNIESNTHHRISPIELPRINGEIDFSKVEEIVLRTAEKTQFAGRFGIVVAKIEDLVQAPEFIGFRPVIVIGKLTYRREGKSYVCHIQWEKVCLVTPAFNKVKRLDKGLTSRFNHAGTEITKDFLMSAKGDIPTFIKNVKELFNTTVATESDLTDKEHEKLNALANNNLKSNSATDVGGAKSGDRAIAQLSSKDSDPKKTSEHHAANGSHKKNESDTLLPSQTHKTNESKKSEGVEESNTESKALKETEKTKKSNAAVVGSEGVDATRGDGIVPRVSDPGGGSSARPKNERNQESASKNDQGARDIRNPESNSGGTSRGESGTEVDPSNSASGRSAPGASGGEPIDRSGNANAKGTSQTRSNASNESNRENRTVVNVHHVDGSNGRGTSSDQTQDNARQPYQYGYDQEFGNSREQVGASSIPLSSTRRDTTSSGTSAPLADISPVADVGSGDYMGSTTAGCDIRVDLNQLRAFQQERLIVRRNGREERSECKDGNTVYTIHKDYNHPYEVDLNEKKAYPTYSYYYLDGTGRRKDVHIAGRIKEKDINNPVLLQETEEGCDAKEEYGRDSTTMVKCKRKFYFKHSGEKEFATPCLETTIKSRVVYTNEGCPVYHDLSAKKSFIQNRRVYQFPGDSTPTEYSSCEPENRQPIPHETKLCEPEVENGKCFERKRVEIKLNGRYEVISPCARVSVNGTPLEKEYESSYSHLSDKSHPYMRKYYTFENKKHYVTGLEVDLTTVFQHRKRVLSYENKDEIKKAIPLEQSYFKGINGHEVDVIIAQGNPVDYENTRETEIKTEGTPTYEGCNKITRQFKYLKWKRPDGSYYFEKTNEEEPLREYVCQAEYVTEKKVLKTIYSFFDQAYTTQHNDHYDSWTRTHGTNTPVFIVADEKKTYEEMLTLFKGNGDAMRHNGSKVNEVLTYKVEESTYVVLKRNGVIVGNRSLQASRTFDETVKIGSR